MTKPRTNVVQESAITERAAKVIPEFCSKYRFTRRHYYTMKKQGKHPGELRIGKRVVITPEAEAAWVAARHAEALAADAHRAAGARVDSARPAIDSAERLAALRKRTRVTCAAKGGRGRPRKTT